MLGFNNPIPLTRTFPQVSKTIKNPEFFLILEFRLGSKHAGF